MIRFPVLDKKVSVPVLVVRKGETLTVYLRTGDDSSPLQQIQVELRVTENGKPEIYCDDMTMSKFMEWYQDESS